MSTRIASTSTEYVQVPVAAQDTSGVPINPTNPVLPVFVTFTEPSDPPPDAGSDSWREGSWAARSIGNRTQYLAQVLVGPASPDGALSKGEYIVWVKIPVLPETVIRRAEGSLFVV